MRRLLALLTAAVALTGCSGRSAGVSAVSADVRDALAPTASESAGRGAPADWPRFGYDAERSGVSRSATGLPISAIAHLRRRVLHVAGTVDSSPIYLHAVTVHGRRRGVFVVTTSYGITIALDAAGGRRLWQYVPPSARRLTGTYQITNASPVADPDRRYVYAASPDGRVRKLRLADGREVRHDGWPAAVTRNAAREKIASALNLSGSYVYATTGGYVGDEPPYQGHIVAISRRTGRFAGVFNSLCSNRHRLIVPSSCRSSDSAIWARAGAVVEPGSGRLLVSTGNGPFDGRTDWGDSVLELTPRTLRLHQSYTPRDAGRLEADDADLGSSAPAILPAPGRDGRPRYVLQGGKDGVLKLLSLNRLNNRTGRAGARRGGELQRIGRELRFTAPAVWRRGGRVFVFTAGSGGTQAFELRGRPSRLRLLWSNGRPGTSPVIAGGLVYVYDNENGGLNVYRAGSPHPFTRLPAGGGHWNSPVVAGGRILLPEGSANDHAHSGLLSLYLP